MKAADGGDLYTASWTMYRQRSGTGWSTLS